MRVVRYHGSAVRTLDTPQRVTPAPRDVQQDVFNDPRPVWPDVAAKFDPDTAALMPGKRWGESSVKVPDLRALALAADTDWDMVWITFNGETERKLLSPGVVLFPDAGVCDGYRVDPYIAGPATRLATVPGRGRLPPLTALRFYLSDADDHTTINAIGGVPFSPREWDGVSAWGAPGAPVFWLRIDDANGAAPRPADLSPDGVSNFADLVMTGAIKYLDGATFADHGGVLYVGGVSGSDNNGNPNDATNPTPKVYRSGYVEPMSPYFYGALAIDEWIADAPSCDYVPRLAPERVVHLAAKVIDASGDFALLTVPALNVEAVSLLGRYDASATGTLALQLGAPLPEETIEDAALIRSAGVAVAPGDVAMVQTDNIHPYVQAIATTNGGSGPLREGAMLVLRRKVTC